MRQTVDTLVDSPLRKMVSYHLGWTDATGQSTARAGGKGLRPTLCLLSCEAAGGNSRDCLGVAAAIELIHNFSLVHDDVQDESLTRHHRPTVWSIWGTGQAINVGDAIFALAQLAALGTSGNFPAKTSIGVLRCLNETCLKLVTGQTYDLAHERRLDITVDDYYRMVAGKTSALIGAACELGALVAGVDSERVAAFRRFGEDIGTAFQIVDDVLGIWGDEHVTGKPSADDVRKQKVTLPILEALRALDEDDRQRLAETYAGPEVGEEDIKTVLVLLDRAGTRASVERTAQQFLTDGLRSLESVAPGATDLESLARRFVERNR